MMLPSRRNANFYKIDVLEKSSKNHQFLEYFSREKLWKSIRISNFFRAFLWCYFCIDFFRIFGQFRLLLGAPGAPGVNKFHDFFPKWIRILYFSQIGRQDVPEWPSRRHLAAISDDFMGFSATQVSIFIDFCTRSTTFIVYLFRIHIERSAASAHRAPKYHLIPVHDYSIICATNK